MNILFFIKLLPPCFSILCFLVESVITVMVASNVMVTNPSFLLYLLIGVLV